MTDTQNTTPLAADSNTISRDVSTKDSESNRPLKRQKMDEAEVKKYETESAKLAKVADYREQKGVASLKSEYVFIHERLGFCSVRDFHVHR